VSAFYDDGVHGGRFYVGGAGVQVLNGAAWQSMNTGLSGTAPVYALDVLEDGLGPGGRSLYTAFSTVYRWEADHWQSLGTPSSAKVHALVMYDDRSGGGLLLHAVSGTTLYKRLSTGSWTPLGTLTVARDPNQLVQRVVVFDEDGDGPLPSSIYFCSSVSSATRAGASGVVSTASGLIRWDGQAFSAMPNTLSAAQGTLPFGGWIKCATVFDDGSGPRLYISGHAPLGGPSIVRWKSSTQMWDPVGWSGGSTNGAAYGMAQLNDSIGPIGRRLYAFTAANEAFNVVQPSSQVIAWDGVAWSAVRNLPPIPLIPAFYHAPVVAGRLGAGGVPALLVNRDGAPVGMLACPRCKGDVNLDGAMTAADRVVIASHMGMTNQFWSGGDLDGNNVVNAADLSLICPADFNCDGEANVPDVFDFINAWMASDARADHDDSGGLSVQDIFEYLNSWFAGCS
jgi:hypothetical protein